MIGRTIGKYRIVAQLGRGGMGTVYKAVDETLDRDVAIKILNPELVDTEVMKRFRTEATTLAKLNHPEIATIYELFRSETDLLMVMEFVRGETLDKLSDRLGPLPPERAAYLIDRILSALEHAHRAGIVHRDMKPANVMVTETGGVKIMDFGIARVRGAEHMTIDGYMMGTPAYMPPEQVLGQDVDGRADLYSVGVVFYRLLTGTLPFKADTAIGMVQKQISDAPTPLRLYRDGLPDWCEALLHRALAKAPADRFATAEEFRAAIARATGSVTGTMAAEEATAPPAAELETTPPPQSVLIENVGPTPTGSAPIAAAPTTISEAKTPSPSMPTVRVAPATVDAATIVLRRRHFAFAGSMIAIVAIGAVLAYVAIRRPASAPTTTSATTSSPSASAPQSPGPPPAPATAPPTRPAPATTPGAPPVPTSTVDRQNDPPVSVPPGIAKPTSSGRTDTGATVADAPATPSSRVPAGRSGGTGRTFLPLAFDAKALISEGNRQRERDAAVHFADGKVIVVAEDNPNDVVHAVPYDAILSISYSTGRDPLWNSPEGPAAVARAGSGLGIFRGPRHWVTLRTKDTTNLFVVLRFPTDVQVGRAIAALEERTSRAVELVVERKDAK
jgi:serine/threonine-protein kinase